MYWTRAGRPSLYPLDELLATSRMPQGSADCIKFIANEQVGPTIARGEAVAFRVVLHARTHAPPH